MLTDMSDRLKKTYTFLKKNFCISSLHSVLKPIRSLYTEIPVLKVSNVKYLYFQNKQKSQGVSKPKSFPVENTQQIFFAN